MRANALPSTTGYADRTNTKAPAWHELVAADVLLNNLATGLFLVAAFCELAAPARFVAVASWAYPLALVLLLADLTCLVLDLGNPFRFHHMLRVFKPSSPMSLGTWCLTAFSLFLTVIVAVEAITVVGWLPDDSGAMWWVRKLAVAGGLPFAFGSAAYKGVLFSTSAQPGWKDARWLGAYLVNSAVALGAGLLLLIATLMGETNATSILHPAVMLLVVLNAIAIVLLTADVRPLLSRLYSRNELLIAKAVLFLTGFVLPLGLLLVGGRVAAGLAVALIVLASLAVRVVLVRLPHVAVEKPTHAENRK
jgi:hypothetical protein